MSAALQALERHLQQAVGKTVIGLRPVIKALTVALVARGHVLLQGPPGLGKTLLGKTLAATLGGAFKRVQATADLMPADIIGVHVFDAAKGEFVFRPGPIFADVLLVDEVNRTGPKTQSALLEAMEERQVSVERAAYRLPADFLVIATQNPRDFEGTYPLPESQLDRFMLRIDMRYPSREDELAILSQYGGVTNAPVNRGETIPSTLLADARASVDAVHLAPELYHYVLELATATRQDAHIALGLSTRGVLALLRAARITAGLRGSTFVTPDDVKEMVSFVIPHRLVLAPEALLEGITEQVVTQKVLERVAVPR